MNRLHARIAVSEAAAWTARRFFGGHYRIIPNGVHLQPRARASRAPSERRAADPVRRPGRRSARACRCCWRPSRRCASTCRRRSRWSAPSPEEVAHMMLDGLGHRRRSARSPRRRSWRELREADVLCAPSLGGESFGMVLTEAFAAATPVVASDIPGYRDVVRDGVDGVLTRARRRARARRGAARAGARPGAPRARWRARPASARSASPGRTSPREALDSYEQAIATARRAAGRRRRAARAARAATGWPRATCCRRCPRRAPAEPAAAAPAPARDRAGARRLRTLRRARPRAQLARRRRARRARARSASA